MVGMRVANNDPFDRLIRHFPNPLQQPVTQRRRTQRIEHHYSAVAYYKTCIGSVAFVNRSRYARMPNDVIDWSTRDLMEFERQARFAIRRRNRLRSDSGSAVSPMADRISPYTAPLAHIRIAALPLQADNLGIRHRHEFDEAVDVLRLQPMPSRSNAAHAKLNRAS